MKLITGITVLLCFFFGVLSAQPKPLPDSIRLEFPELESLITFELRQYDQDKELIRDLPAQLRQLLNHLESSLTDTDKRRPHNVDVGFKGTDGDSGYSISVREPDQAATNITVSNNSIVELLPPGWTIAVVHKHARIHIYSPTITQLSELSQVGLDQVIGHIDKDPESHRQKRFGLITRLIVVGGEVQTAKSSHRLPGDMLGLHAGAGVGLLRDRFYPEFNMTTSLYLANRYRQNFQRISAHYELKLFTDRSTEGAYLSQPASFISLSYALNFSPERPRWTGIGAGFLVHNRSELFKGKTLKLFLETDIGSSKLNLIPELYLTDDYKEAIMGIKLNYKF